MLNVVALTRQSCNMVVQGPACSAGWKVRPHSNLHFVCQHYPVETFRVGIDFRGAQSGGGSGQRGIGRYTTDLVLGLLEHGRPIVLEEQGKLLEVVLFHAQGVPVPAEINGLVSLAPVRAPSWSDEKKPLWLRLPKIRSIKRFHELRFNRALRSQRRAIERQVRLAELDILHIPSALDVGSYPIFDYPCPVVMTLLDTIVISLKEITYDRFPWFLQTYYHEQADNLKRADRIVAISQASKADGVREFGLDPSKIDVIYPAVSSRYGVPAHRPTRVESFDYFLFCSVPDPHKNPRIVMEAFAQLDCEHHLVFVSPESHHETIGIRQFAEELGIAERFHITGFVSEEELIGLFHHATALVSPSQMEGFGLPVAQAMRAGVPVITSNTSAQAEIAAGVGILVSPNSIAEVLSAMKLCTSSPMSRPMLPAQERAKWFDSERVTRQLIEAYLKTKKVS